MATNDRPLSPHLQIYRWQWTMALSILHRATGVALSVGTLLLVFWLIRWQNDDYDNCSVSRQVKDKALKGGVMGGFTLVVRSPYLAGICVFILLYATSITFVQIRQAELVADVDHRTGDLALFELVETEDRQPELLEIEFCAHAREYPATISRGASNAGSSGNVGVRGIFSPAVSFPVRCPTTPLFDAACW